MNVSFDARGLLRSPALWLGCAMAFCFLIGINPAHAADGASGGGGGGLPWEGPIDRIVQSISGPVAFGVSMLGIIGCGFTLIWGGEVSEFLRRLMYLVLVVCLIVFARNLLTGTLFSGAMVPDTGIALKNALSPLGAAIGR